jgi:amino acid permease
MATTSSSDSPDGNDHHERSPLLISSASSVTATTDLDSESEPADTHTTYLSAPRGSATLVETILNLAKTCMGTGCLALPFAAQQGGLLLFIFGTYGIAAWNCYAVQRLCQSKEHVGVFSSKRPFPVSLSATITHENESDAESINNDHGAMTPSSTEGALSIQPVAHPPPGTATLGKVGWYALGPMGLKMVDVMLVTLLLGIVVTYQDAMQSFLHDTPFTTGWKAMDAIIIALIVAPLSVVPDTGYLAKASAFGLTILGFALAVIAGNGILCYDTTTTTSLFHSLHWLPQDGITGISRWFGCLVFGFGVVPMTFNYQEAMAVPTKIVQANNVALFGVATLYILIGIFLSILYPNIPGDVLHELPPTGIIPTLTRLTMVLVVLATAPLILVPCAELLEGKVIHQFSLLGSSGRGHGGGGHRPRLTDVEKEQLVKVTVRFALSLATAGVSVGIPSFVAALSLVGCFCVALVSFGIPPLLHLVLLLRIRCSKCKHYWVDSAMLVLGLAATFITTITTIEKMASVSAPSH